MNRRAFCGCLGACGVVGVVGCTTRPGATDTPRDDSESWPTFGANHRHTGTVAGVTGPDTASVAWEGIGDAPTVLCPPTVVDGTVYVGSAKNAIHAFDAATGELQWEYETTSYVETAPTVVTDTTAGADTVAESDTVYTADADGVVYALSTGGELRWRFETNTNLHSRTVALSEDTLIVATAGTMPAVASGETDASRAGTVVGLDAATGESRWTYTGPSDWFTGPAVGSDRAYVGNHDGTLVALDPTDGTELWTWQAPGENAGLLAPPTVSNGTVYLGVHGLGHLIALDAEGGQQRWATELKAPNVKSSPAVTDQRVYVGATGTEASDYDAPDEQTPTPTPTETGTDQAAGMPTVRISGSVFAISRTDGTIEWRYEADHDFRSSPAVVGDRVYVGGGDRLLALGRDAGSEQWHVTFDDYVDSSPAIADGRAYIGSADGSLYAIGE